MTDDILKAYKEVESAVERYIRLLHDHVKCYKTSNRRFR